MSTKPNILFVMTDQQRFDTIAALGNSHIHTPNMDRLVRRGLTFERAYSSCPVCVPARYTIRTGCESPTTRYFNNGFAGAVEGQPEDMEERCGGPFLARTMAGLGYRTFGVGKFHTKPWNEDIGYETLLYSEEGYKGPGQREGDAYARWIAEEHPEYSHLELLMGERSEMYYMPQTSLQKAEHTVEAWAADRAVEQLAVEDERPFFGFVSFIGPHPPLAPPIPFNRLYDPDRMPDPVKGTLEHDHTDPWLPWMNRIMWAEDITDSHARVLKARYYGEITYIDWCLGKVLDAVEARPDADNTLICFYSDHGDHMGDHHGWQKESFYEASTHVPFLLSWPEKLPSNERRSELVCLTDLFAIATGAADATEVREGHDVLGMLAGEAPPREDIIGMLGRPGTDRFKIMVRESGRWKYVYFANGGCEQLFDVEADPHELVNRAAEEPETVARLRARAVEACRNPGAADALEGGKLKAFPRTVWQSEHIYQFDVSKGITGFPEHPSDVLRAAGLEK